MGLWKGNRLAPENSSWGVPGTAGIWVEVPPEGVGEEWAILLEGGT